MYKMNSDELCNNIVMIMIYITCLKILKRVYKRKILIIILVIEHKGNRYALRGNHGVKCVLNESGHRPTAIAAKKYLVVLLLFIFIFLFF